MYPSFHLVISDAINIFRYVQITRTKIIKQNILKIRWKIKKSITMIKNEILVRIIHTYHVEMYHITNSILVIRYFVPLKIIREKQINDIYTLYKYK